MRCIFDNPDEFADVMCGFDGRYVPTARATHPWWIEAARLEDVLVQQIQIGGAATFAGNPEEGCLTIGIPLGDTRGIRVDGQPLHADGFIFTGGERPLICSAPRAIRWVSIVIPAAEAARIGYESATGTAAGDTVCMRGRSSELRRVVLLVALLCSEDATIRLHDAAATARARQDVISAVYQLLHSSSRDGTAVRRGRRPFLRDRIIAQCLGHLRETLDQPVPLEALCRVASVSQRTLRNIFHEYFGVGPNRFIRARHLQEIRTALLRSAPDDSVSSVVTRFGVWDFSLFARSYRALFGESPSQTLRKRGSPRVAAGRAGMHSPQSWMNYASVRFDAFACR